MQRRDQHGGRQSRKDWQYKWMSRWKWWTLNFFRFLNKKKGKKERRRRKIPDDSFQDLEEESQAESQSSGLKLFPRNIVGSESFILPSISRLMLLLSTGNSLLLLLSVEFGAPDSRKHWIWQVLDVLTSGAGDPTAHSSRTKRRQTSFDNSYVLDVVQSLLTLPPPTGKYKETSFLIKHQQISTWLSHQTWACHPDQIDSQTNGHGRNWNM